MLTPEKMVHRLMNRTSRSMRGGVIVLTSDIILLCDLALAVKAYGTTECDKHDGDSCPEIEIAWRRVMRRIERLERRGILDMPDEDEVEER